MKYCSANNITYPNFLGTFRIIATENLFAIKTFYSLLNLTMSGVIPPLPHYAFMAGRGLTPYFTLHQAWSNWGPNTGISAK